MPSASHEADGDDVTHVRGISSGGKPKREVVDQRLESGTR
jgi:hypothetical protein